MTGTFILLAAVFFGLTVAAAITDAPSSLIGWLAIATGFFFLLSLWFIRVWLLRIWNGPRL